MYKWLKLAVMIGFLLISLTKLGVIDLGFLQDLFGFFK